MNISSLGALASNFQPQINAGGSVNSTARVGGVGQDNDGDHDGSGVRGAGQHRGGGGAFMQSVLQALSSIGVTPNASALGAQAGGADSDGDHDGSGVSASTGSQNPRQALHAFMHDLFQAIRQSGQTTSAGSGTTDTTAPASGYSPIENGLQNLIAGLNANSGTGNDALSNLQKDFQNLVTAFGGAAGAPAGTGTASSAGSPSLLTFLQHLEKNLQTNEPLPQPPTLGIQTTA